MQVPVFGYRCTSGVPASFALVDVEDIQEMESFAGTQLKLTFNKYGDVQVDLRYCRYVLESLRHGPKKNSRLLNVILGRLPFMHVRNVTFRDGNVMNFRRSNIFLKGY